MPRNVSLSVPSYLLEKHTSSSRFAIDASDSIRQMRPSLPDGSGYSTGPISGKPVGWMRGSLLDGSSSAVMKTRRQPDGTTNPPKFNKGLPVSVSGFMICSFSLSVSILRKRDCTEDRPAIPPVKRNKDCCREPINNERVAAEIEFAMINIDNILSLETRFFCGPFRTPAVGYAPN